MLVVERCGTKFSVTFDKGQQPKPLFTLRARLPIPAFLL